MALLKKENSLDLLADEELLEAHYLSCKLVHEQGEELELRDAVSDVRCREFFTDESWIRDANHRSSVFQEISGPKH